MEEKSDTIGAVAGSRFPARRKPLGRIDVKGLLDCAMDIGEQMLVSGAEVHRAEDSIKRMCTAMGAERTDIFIIPSSMVATVHTPSGESFTQTRRITSVGTDLERLDRLNDLSRRICEKHLSEAEIRREYGRIVAARRYPFWVECMAYAVIAGAFTLFFGGGIADAAVSMTVGLLLRFVVLLTDRMLPNKIFAKFACSFLASALAFFAVRLSLISGVDKVIIGNIMLIIPGVGFTTALRDLFTGDSIAGLLRSIEAVLIALAIAAGYLISDSMYDISVCQQSLCDPDIAVYARHQLFSRLPETIRLINAEEDLGIEGLRSLKQGMRPVGLLKMFEGVSQ